MPNRVPFPPFSQRVFFLFRVAPRGKSDLFRALDRGTSAENCSFIWPGDHSTTRPLHSRHFGGRWKRGREINSERNKEWGREIDTRRRWRASAFWRISVSKLFFSSIRSSRQSFLDVVNARFALVKSISKITFVFFFIRRRRWIVILEESFEAFLLESVNLSSARNSIVTLFTNYARALSRPESGIVSVLTTKLGRFLSKLKLHTRRTKANIRARVELSENRGALGKRYPNIY